MHFKTFLDLQEDKEEILEIVSNQITKKEDVCESYSREMNEILDRYCTFTQDTEKGLYGKTAKFWIQYVYLIHLYHKFTRSVRTGDLDLLFRFIVSCLPEITNIFFAMNNLNYARWLVKYYYSIIKFPDTHREVYSDFKMADLESSKLQNLSPVLQST